MTEQCGNCRFYGLSPVKDEPGMCRRFPPQCTTIPDRGRMTTHASFPPTLVDAWCGEWAPAVRRIEE